MLNRQLADPLDLYSQGKKAHRNSGAAIGTTRMGVRSQLCRISPEIAASKQVLEVLTQRHGAYRSSTRVVLATATQVGDQNTENLGTEISRTIDKHLWMLVAHFQN
jgi:DNA-binding ferritin-like protein